MKHFAGIGFKSSDHALCAAFIAGSAIYAAVHVFLMISKMSFGAALVDPESLSDFFVFHSAARFVGEGGAATALYDLAAFKRFQISLGAATGGLHPFNYPPSYIFAILPFGLLPYTPALLTWLAATLLLFVLAARCAGLRAAETIAVIVAPAAMVNISAGQNGFLTSALLVAGLFLLERRPLAAGTLFGLLTFKPHLGLLIPVALLARRQWRAIFAAALSAGLLLGASLVVFGRPSGSWPNGTQKSYRSGPRTAAGTPP